MRKWVVALLIGALVLAQPAWADNYTFNPSGVSSVGGTAGQFYVTGTGGQAAWTTLSGSLSCSTTTPGNCSATGVVSSYTGGVSITGNQTNGADQLSSVNLNGVINVKTYGAKGDGTTDDTTAIQAAINATPEGHTLLFPALPAGKCYLVSSTLTVPHAIHFEGQGWATSSWGSIFSPTNGVTANGAGSIICSSVWPGPAIQYQGTEEGADFSNFLLVGKPPSPTQYVVNTTTDVTGTMTVTTAGTNPFTAGEMVFVAGNSVPDYDGVCTISTIISGTQFNCKNFWADNSNGSPGQLANGANGTATAISIGLEVGYNANLSGGTTYYVTGVSSYHMGIANFGVNLALNDQNGRYFHPELDGAYANNLLNASAGTGENDDQFFGLSGTAGGWTNIDWRNGGHSDGFYGIDLESVNANDSSASEVKLTGFTALMTNSYIEADLNNFTGDCIQSMANIAYVQDGFFCGAPAAHALYIRSSNPQIIGGQTGTITVAATAGGWGDIEGNTITDNGGFAYYTSNGNFYNYSHFLNLCAGTQALTAGAATVSNACITTSCRPSCTDESNANAIKCNPSASSLAMTGTGTDTIAWSCQ